MEARSKCIASIREPLYIAEQFPVLADCSNAPRWIKQHAKLGRKKAQTVHYGFSPK
jgi:hypothetical protein